MELDELKMLDDITKDNIARVLWSRKFRKAQIPNDILNNLNDKENSPENFGKRMQYRLQELIDSSRLVYT